MVYTNVILKQLEKYFEDAKFEVEWDREEEGKESDINSHLFRNFLGMVEQFYLNHKEGKVDEVEFDDGMKTINDFLNLFNDTTIEYEPSQRAVEYLLSVQEEDEEEHSDEEIEEAIAEFCKDDNRNTLRVLVINKNNEFEVRESFNQHDELIEKDDLKVLAVSIVGYDCDIDCCDNCEKEEYNEDIDESYCTEGCSRIKCAVEQQLAEDYDEYLWTVQGVYDREIYD